MDTIKATLSSFREGIDKSLQLCQFVERGQAQTPLSDLFTQLTKEQQSHEFSVTLLCLNKGDREQVLKWLMGQQFILFSLHISSQIGLLEVDLKDRGYSLQKSTGERLDFDNWEQLIKAIDEAGVMDSQEVSTHLKVSGESERGIKHLHLLMPESAAFIQQSPALLTRLLRETNVLMVAASPTHTLSVTEREVLGTLLDEMSCFWPLFPVDELHAELSIPERGWWDHWHPDITLPPKLITTHIEADLPEFLINSNDQVRQTLKLLQLSKRYSSACDAIEDRFEQEIKQLNSRRKREGRRSQSETRTPVAVGPQNIWSRLRTQLGDELGSAIKKIQERNRKLELNTSTFNATLKEHLNSISSDDLTQEEGYKQIKLSLGDSYLNDLLVFLRKQLRSSLQGDIAKLAETLAELEQRATTELERETSTRMVLTTPALDEKALWKDLEEILGVEMRYQGEMPKRTIFDRLSEGRRSAFVILMSASLLGYMGIDVRNSGWLGVLILPVFIGGIIYTYRSWKQEDAARLDKELTRVRDEVLNIARRMLSDINRQKIAKLVEYSDAIKRSWQEQLEKRGSEWQAREQDLARQQTQQARDRMNQIDTQLREWQGQQAMVQQLKNSATQLQRTSERAVAQLAKK